MDYATLDDNCAANFIRDKKVIVTGFHKFLADVAAETFTRNGKYEISHDHMIKSSKDNIYLLIN